MSEVNQSLNTGSQSITNYDVSKIFIWDNRYEKATLNNSAYGPVTYKVGTLMGRVTSTGYVKPLRSDATDGSQIPVGVLADDYTVDGGASQEVSLCYYGDIAEEKIIFDLDTDNMDTSVTDGGGYTRRMRDRIGGDTVGIKLRQTNQMSGYDNQ